MKRVASLGLWVVALCFAAGDAHAHRSSESYLTLGPLRSDGTISGQLRTPLRDLDEAAALDDGDGALTWGELRSREGVVHEVLTHALVFSQRGEACTLAPDTLELARLNAGNFAQIAFSLRCPEPTAKLSLHYRFLQDRDNSQRLAIRQLRGRHRLEGAFRMGTGSTLQLPGWDERSDVGPLSLVTRFGLMGVEHIATGFDHLLFLMVLLVPALLKSGAQRLRATALHVGKVVSAFTLSHCITLSLASLGVVEVAAEVIEPAIAASIAFSALVNLVPALRGESWPLAFSLGLLHGFGFASGLADAQLEAGSAALSLFGFNLGVELGQLFVLALALPLLWVFRRSPLYRPWAFSAVSLAAAGLGAAWFFERI